MESPPEQGRLVYCIRVVVCYVPLPHVVAKLYRHTPNASQRLSVHIVSLFVGEVPHFIVDRQVLVLLWGLSPALGFGGRPDVVQDPVTYVAQSFSTIRRTAAETLKQLVDHPECMLEIIMRIDTH